jgi:glycerol-3-phosphate acyltransferase PlsY
MAAYLIGAVPTSWIAARLGAGIDLRQHGSRNLGATNLYRVLGWRYAIPVGLFDIAKGTVPVFVLPPLVRPASAAWVPLAIGVAPFSGTCSPSSSGSGEGRGSRPRRAWSWPWHPSRSW